MIRKLMWKLGFRRVRSWYGDPYGLVYENWLWLYGPRTERKDYIDELEFCIARSGETKMSDRQCPSCGGFCGRGGCEREMERLQELRRCAMQNHDAIVDSIQYMYKRKPLTDAEIFNTAADYYEGYGFKALEFARAIERAHGIGEA